LRANDGNYKRQKIQNKMWKQKLVFVFEYKNYILCSNFFQISQNIKKVMLNEYRQLQSVGTAMYICAISVENYKIETMVPELTTVYTQIL
jgi:hypothetical protein